MHDLLLSLADLGRASWAAFWLPVALWTGVALVAEAALRLGRADASIGLPVRGALLAALPLTVVVSALARTVALNLVVDAGALMPAFLLPDVVIGTGADVAVAAPAALPVGSLIAGFALVLAALVGAAGLFRLAVSTHRLGLLRRSLAPASAGTQARLDLWRERLGLQQPVVAAQAPEGVAPFTVGWRRPVVAVPSGLDEDALDAVLAHELAHVARADYVWHLGQCAVTALFRAHPLAHALARGLDLDRERAADTAVLTLQPSTQRAYANLLLSYASIPPPALALGIAPGSSFIKRRIDAMMHPLSPQHRARALRLGRLFAAAALVLTASLAFVTASPADASDASSAVEGIVTDADTGAPIAGANVRVAGTAIGATTGSNGRYRLDVSGGERVLLVSASGYTSRSVKLEERQAILDIALTTRDVPVGPPSDADAPDVFVVVEEMPVMQGGMQALIDRLEYPADARAEGVEGQVVVQFVVSESGEPTDIFVRHSADNRLTKAAVEAVGAMRFTPGRQRGRVVPVQLTLPITFEL